MKSLFVVILLTCVSLSACNWKKKQAINTIESQAQAPNNPQKNLPAIKPLQEDSILLEESFRGKYIGLEEGEYFHVVVEDEEGDTLSLWMSNYVDKSTFALMLEADTLSGKGVTVRMREIHTYLPEAEATIILPEVVSIAFE